VGTGQYVYFIIQTARTNQYDNSGHLISSATERDTLNLDGTLAQSSASYRSQELYRSDALGRRVWTQVARGSRCQLVEPETNCENTAIFTLWDGDQLLDETMRGADPNTLPSWAIASSVATQTVRYIQGPEIDEPLEVTKGQQVVFPLPNYRGSLVTGGCPVTMCNTSTIVFTAGTRGITATWQPTAIWFGSLLSAPNDASGYVYQRNRYLDPSSGRFTQEDPLGVGGGLNVYGFAGGDPVTYSDPFGLCPVTATDPVPCSVTYGATLGAIGGGLGVLAAAGCTVGSGGICLVGAPAIIGGGAALGTLAGGAIGNAIDVLYANSAGIDDADAVTARMSKLTNRIRSILIGILIGKGGGLSDEQEVVHHGGAKPATEQTTPKKAKEKKLDGSEPPDQDP
jgi:RHS repeat-associated protein